MSEGHQHTGKVYMAGKQLVCIECHPEEIQGLNECFCKCHEDGKPLCTKCKRFHVTAGQ